MPETVAHKGVGETFRPDGRPAAGYGWRLLAWAATLVILLSVALAIGRNVVQVTDSLVPILEVQGSSVWQVFVSKVNETGFSRPLYYVATRLLFDISPGHHFLAFKAFNISCLAALFVLFLRVTRVRTKNDAYAYLFALMVLIGMRTFLGTVWEGYPINHYLEIAVFCMAALALSDSRGGWLVDIAAPLLFCVASLTLESGLLVWVVLVVARLVGLRGVSWTSVGITTALLAAYMVLRFGVLGIGLPGVAERATGYGFARIEPDEIRARFVATGHLSYFYLYNVASAFASIFLSDPTNGTWELTGRVWRGTVDPVVVTYTISALVATGLLVWYAAARWRDWMARRFTRSDQIVLIALAVVAGNAAICFSYVKDEVMSTGGVFYALAVFAAAREAVTRWERLPRAVLVNVALAIVVFAGSTGWTIRGTALHYQMLRIGAADRIEWAHVDEWLARQDKKPSSERDARLVAELQVEAMNTRPLSLLYVPRRATRWFSAP